MTRSPSQAGIYHSGTTTVSTPGNVYWVETLYNAGGEAIVEGTCGTPGETTVITDQPETLTVTTSAVPEVILGEPAHDVATVTGAVPAGASLVFEAYRQDGDTATCTPDELVFTSASTAVGGPGEYRSTEVIFETMGTYYWIETLTGSDGTVLHRGLCGAPDETTTVIPVPVTPELPETPSGPPFLASTGAGDWLPLGIGGGILALAGGLTLMFGRATRAPPRTYRIRAR